MPLNDFLQRITDDGWGWIILFTFVFTVIALNLWCDARRTQARR
jgi:hypothetical protein